MIVKSFEIKKINNIKNFFLLYGKNEGHKNQIINNLLKKNEEIFRYDEQEVLINKDKFIENILTKSLFEKKKIIIIKRASEKILQIVEELDKREIKDLTIIINSDVLEKKSKLRSFFEKHKNFITIPVYPDNHQALSKLTFDFLNEKKIQLSPLNVNLIVERCNSDRDNLFNELKKIENFCLNGKKLKIENILSLINLSENHSISSLIDNCLTRNKKKIIFILNENNFSNEDCIQIIRIFLNKAKKILALSSAYKKNKNIDLTISSAKPPIFWKDKEITKQQILLWPPKKINQLIYKLSSLELLIKKNISNSIYLITDFMMEQV